MNVTNIEDIIRIIIKNSFQPNYYYKKYILEKIGFFKDHIANKTVLDVGCNEGFYSFSSELYNAKKIISIDHNHYFKDFFYKNKYELDSKLEFIAHDVYNIDELKLKSDILVFYDVLYHLEDPFLILRKLKHIFDEYLFICTLYNNENGNCCKIYEPYELTPTDSTNRWVMSKISLEKMFKCCKLEIVTCKIFDESNRILFKLKHSI